MIMEIVAINSIAPLYFEDAEAAEDTLRSLKAGSKWVEGAALYLADGRQFATYERPDNSLNDLLFPKIVVTEGMVREKNRVIISRKVDFKGKTVGFLLVQMDMTGYNHELVWYSLQILVIGIIAILIGIVLSLYLKRQLLGPVSHLVNTVKKISSEKNFSIRAKVFSNDEMGDLINGFNEMIGEIQERDHELERHRASLEDKVTARTLALTDANNELKRLNLELFRANSAKSDFLSRMSHELRTPLNGIIGYANLLMKDGVDFGDMEIERLSVILQCGEHLLLMINDILDFSKIEAGRFEIKINPFDLVSFVETTAKMARSKAGEKGLAIILSMDERLPSKVLGDYQRLRQVLLNLLSNAVKFTDQGIITLEITPVGKRIRFMVTDTGSGISKQGLKDIFKAFVQVGAVHKKLEGTGLGLAISRHLVELMGSTLCVKSVVGKGSSFWFDLVLPGKHGSNKVALAWSPNDQPIPILPEPPPHDLMIKLREKALIGDIAGILCWCKENRESNHKYSTFFSMMEKLAKQFKINDINMLVSMVTEIPTEIEHENNIGGG